MLLFLQITLTILSAICAAAVIPLGAFFDWPWAIGFALGAVLFFVLMLLCKQSRALKEDAQKVPEEKTENAENDENGKNS